MKKITIEFKFPSNEYLDLFLQKAGYKEKITTWEDKEIEIKQKDLENLSDKLPEGASIVEIGEPEKKIVKKQMPILDEKGNPKLDDNGNEITEEREIEIVDENSTISVKYRTPKEIDNPQTKEEFIQQDIEQYYIEQRVKPLMVDALTEQKQKEAEEKFKEAEQEKQSVAQKVSEKLQIEVK